MWQRYYEIPLPLGVTLMNKYFARNFRASESSGVVRQRRGYGRLRGSGVRTREIALKERMPWDATNGNNRILVDNSLAESPSGKRAGECVSNPSVRFIFYSTLSRHSWFNKEDFRVHRNLSNSDLAAKWNRLCLEATSIKREQRCVAKLGGSNGRPWVRSL